MRAKSSAFVSPFHSFTPSILRPIENGDNVCCDVERNGIRRIMRVAAVVSTSFCIVSLSPRSHPHEWLQGRYWLISAKGQHSRLIQEIPADAVTFDYHKNQRVAIVAGSLIRLEF